MTAATKYQWFECACGDRHHYLALRELSEEQVQPTKWEYRLELFSDHWGPEAVKSGHWHMAGLATLDAAKMAAWQALTTLGVPAEDLPPWGGD